MVFLTEFLEGSSSSSPPPHHKYDVFLCFRGADTRNGFTDHLHKALMDANIDTFLDDEEIQTGEDLKPELENAIKSSRSSIIVLSQNYASSTWCLDELVLILEQRRRFGHIVIPIFYHIEPTNIRKQENSFGDALAKHKQRIDGEADAEKRRQRAQKMELWKTALTEVADLKGKDANGRRETMLIEEIVKEIGSRLDLHLRRNIPRLIGMGSSVRTVTSFLKDGSSHTTDILTIWGMAGIGKTSLAKYIYQLHCQDFERGSFLEDIERRRVLPNGLLDLQKQLLKDIRAGGFVDIREVDVCTSMIEKSLPRKKTLLVVDGIDQFEQLDVLVGTKGLFPGSKIIITTKDGSLTEKSRLFETQVPPKHTKHFLKGLDEWESLQLLSLHAFGGNDPKEGYEQESIKVVEYCEGHPLALKVLGSSLRNRDVAEWEDYTAGLEKDIDSRLKDILQMSFDSLPSKNDKDLFVHIACFFVGEDREFTETILKACGIRTLVGIRNLVDRCLLVIGPEDELAMHQLVQGMGRNTVDQESLKKPWKRSRLWRHEESFRVLNQEKGKGNLQGLILDMKMLEKEKLCGKFELKTDAFSKMDNLMLLQLNHVQLDHVQPNEFYNNFPEELRWLCMQGFPLDHIPSDLCMQNLVALDMSYSNFKDLDMSYRNPQQLWKRQKLNRLCSKDKRLLGSLKILDLSFCNLLRSVSGFFELPALETLMLHGCESLIEVCESIEQCHELVLVDLSFCSKLRKLPNIGKLKKVAELILDGCLDLVKFPLEMKDVVSLEVPNANDISRNSQNSSSAIVEVASRIPKSIFHFLPTSLVTLVLDNNNLVNESFPMDLSSLSNLRALSLEGNLIVSLPNCVKNLSRLQLLNLGNCRKLKTIEHPPCTLTSLTFDRAHSLLKVVFDPEMSPLRLHSYHGPSLQSLDEIEIEGMEKIQAIADVEEEVLRRLGWTDLEFLKNQKMKYCGSDDVFPVQMLYQFGIFSTFFLGKEFPKWISDRSKGSSISFTMPSSPNNLRGLNLCSLHTNVDYFNEVWPTIKISNVTKNLTWLYMNYISCIQAVDEECLIWLSHWMFGKNEMEDGDQVTITIAKEYDCDDGITRECGFSLVYDDDGKMEEEDALGYYKSWNHILGGDLSAFQAIPGEYYLHSYDFFGHYEVGLGILFRAFSQRKPTSGILDCA